MNYFAKTLHQLLSERDWSQTEYQRRSGVAQSNISRYLNGGNPEVAYLERLCTPFDDDKARLLVAWLKDQVPEALRSLVSITTFDPGRLEEQPPTTDILAPLTPRGRQVLTELAAACARRPDMVAAAETMLAISKPRD